MKDKATWEEFESTPEVHQVSNRVYYLIPLTFDGKKTTYCFTFVVEENKWYLQHVESIFIRLDKITHPSASIFPDLPEDQKSWMREEIRVSE